MEQRARHAVPLRRILKSAALPSWGAACLRQAGKQRPYPRANVSRCDCVSGAILCVGGARFQDFQGGAGGFLLGFFFAAAFGGGEALAGVPDFDFENFLVLGAGIRCGCDIRRGRGRAAEAILAGADLWSARSRPSAWRREQDQAECVARRG